MIVYFSGMILYYSKIVYLTSWMIVPPVRNWFGSVRSDVFTNRWFVIGTRFGYLVRSYLVRYVVRKLGTKLFGSVRGPKTWYEVIWSGPRSVILPYQFGTKHLFGSVRILFDHTFST